MPASKMVEQDVVRKAGDEYYVFVVSDADLGRYGISPAAWNKILMQDPFWWKNEAALPNLDGFG